MPLQSKAQFRALMAKDPAVGKEFYRATSDFKGLPEYVRGRRKTSRHGKAMKKALRHHHRRKRHGKHK
jgi:hypothetical protein